MTLVLNLSLGKPGGPIQPNITASPSIGQSLTPQSVAALRAVNNNHTIVYSISEQRVEYI